jgi:hypothetical protein
MDKEEARFILRCFRPDGADAENPDFAEALAWAAKDRELGDWLAHERASDAGFANALNAVAIPTSLREEILAGLAVERGESSTYPDTFDRSVMGAMAALRPPLNLRAEILAAMDRTAAAEKSERRLSWRLAVPFAAAAGIGFAFLLSNPPSSKAVFSPPPDEGFSGPPLVGPITTTTTETGTGGNAGTVPISIGKVESGFISTFESPAFTLDLKNPDHHALFEHLKSAKLPCPNTCLPKGLKGIPGLGCRELKIDGNATSAASSRKRANRTSAGTANGPSPAGRMTNGSSCSWARRTSIPSASPTSSEKANRPAGFDSLASRIRPWSEPLCKVRARAADDTKWRDLRSVVFLDGLQSPRSTRPHLSGGGP